MQSLLPPRHSREGSLCCASLEICLPEPGKSPGWMCSCGVVASIWKTSSSRGGQPSRSRARGEINKLEKGTDQISPRAALFCVVQHVEILMGEMVGTRL
jgi:hypothetical protein